MDLALLQGSFFGSFVGGILFTDGFYAGCDACCHIFACCCVPGAKGVGQMPSSKTRRSHHLKLTLSRCLGAKWKQSLSLCSLYFCSSIPGASLLLTRLKYVEQTAPPSDWAESIHTLKLSSRDLANFKNKPCLAALTFIKLHSKSLASSYGPAT